MKLNKFTNISIAVSVALLFSGCSFKESEYSKPNAPIEKTFPKGDAYDSSIYIKEPTNINWGNIILDEKLKEVIKIALKQNRTLKEANANILSAKATYDIQHASQFPAIDGTISGSKARSLSGTDSKGNDTSSISESYKATVGVSSYELDFWGKAKNLSKADFESYLAEIETQRVSKITIISEVAEAWLTIASDKSLLDLAIKTSQSSKKSLDIIKARFDIGVDDKSTFYSAQTVYYQALADEQNYKTLVAQDINALNLLVGEKVSENLLPKNLDFTKEYLSAVPINLSSDVLLKSPDIVAAEHNLKSANANINVARAAYFPSISITTTAGIASSALNNLFSGGAASIWSFVPTITLPIFDWGSKDATLEYAKAQRDSYIAAYELAIQTAFSEVSDALARYGTIEQQLDAQRNLVTASQNSFFISQKRYESGVDDYLTALTSQRTLYSVQQSLISLQLTKMTNRVTLYRVLANEPE